MTQDYTVIPYTTRQNWLELRRMGIGASDIAAVVGISPWSTPHQVWISKTTPDAPEPMTNEDMEWGLRVEGLILDEVVERLDLDPEGLVRGVLVQNRKKAWMLATCDGLHHGDREGLIIEAKKVDAWDWPDGPPPYYLSQIQWQLAVTGIQRGYIAALHRGRRLELYPVNADPAAQEFLVAEGGRFWQSVLAVEPPPVSADDSQFLNQLWPTHEDQGIEIPSDVADELRQAKLAAAAAKTRLDAATAIVKDLMKTADTAYVGEDRICTWKTSHLERVDVKTLRAEEPDIAQTYTRKGSTRRFLIKGA